MAGTKLHVASGTLNCMITSHVYPQFFKHCMVPNTKINANSQNSKLCPHTLLFPLFITRPNRLTNAQQPGHCHHTSCQCRPLLYELDMINK